MYTYSDTHTQTYIYECMCVCVLKYTHTPVYINSHTFTHIYSNTNNTHAHINIYICLNTHTLITISSHTQTQVYIYIYIYLQNFLYCERVRKHYIHNNTQLATVHSLQVTHHNLTLLFPGGQPVARYPECSVLRRHPPLQATCCYPLKYRSGKNIYPFLYPTLAIDTTAGGKA